MSQFQLHDSYNVVVAGAGISGVVAAISAAREGARVLLIECTGSIGGMLTGGRLTKPHGLVENGIYREMLERAKKYGGADLDVQSVGWGSYTGMFDSEVMKRVIFDMVEEENVEILFYTKVIGTIIESSKVIGLEISVKFGNRLVLTQTVIDCTGDGDVCALAGAEFQVGRKEDSKTQPLASYFRLLQVDISKLIKYIQTNKEEFHSVYIPTKPSSCKSDYSFKVHVSGFSSLIEKAKKNGFQWILPVNQIHVKSGMLEGEVNVNATRFHGNALDEKALSSATIEIHKQVYCCYDFLKAYVPGFSKAILLEVAPTLGVRETRRIIGEYVLTGKDVLSEAIFPDSVALSKSAVDIHDPAGEGVIQKSIGRGYEIPYRCLLPRGLEGILVAGRCASVDDSAHGSTRNTPSCAQMGEAAGVACAIASKKDLSLKKIDVKEIQAVLQNRGVQVSI